MKCEACGNVWPLREAQILRDPVPGRRGCFIPRVECPACGHARPMRVGEKVEVVDS